jgi:hypothetical protein
MITGYVICGVTDNQAELKQLCLQVLVFYCKHVTASKALHDQVVESLFSGRHVVLHHWH